MKIGVGIHAPGDLENLAEFHEMLRLADRYGVSHLATGDGVTIEAFTRASVMATLTTTPAIGATMFNPITRHLGTIAVSLASLNYLSNGRAYGILARGDGAVRHVGSGPATMDATKEFFVALRQVLREGETRYQGNRLRLRSPLQEWGLGVTLGMVAEGPKMLGLAGSLADLVQVGTGLTPEVVRDSTERIRQGALQVGRDPDSVTILWGARFCLSTNREEALEGSLTSVASIGNHALRGGLQGKNVPAELHDRIREYHRRFDYSTKGMRGGADTNVAVMEELGLTHYFRERFGVIGTPDEVVERLRQLQSYGVNNLHIRVRRVKDLKLLGEEVIPAVRD